MVQLRDKIYAPIPLTELTDDYSKADTKIYKKNQNIRVCIADVQDKNIVLSARPSKILKSSGFVKDPQILHVSQLKVNDVVRGFIKHVAERGVFVSLGLTVTLFVRISDLSDSYIKDWSREYKVAQLVTGKILALDEQPNRVHFTLKESVINKNYVPPLTFDSLKIGQVVTCKIRKVESYGVFVVVDNSNHVSGLCHRSEIADQKVFDVQKLYEEGDAVKAIVLKLDTEKRRVNFGLKASYFSNDADDGNDEELGGVPLKGDDNDEAPDERKIDLDDVRSIGSEEPDNDDSEDAMDVDVKVPRTDAVEIFNTGFDWTGETLDQDDHVEYLVSDDEDDDVIKKKKRRKSEIKVDKTSDLDKYGPRSVDDFERQLLMQPNSSSLWIQYMAFQLNLSEVDKTRDIAQRALNTINIGEEDEKLNIWVSFLNLENAYGNAESIEDVLKKACQYNDVHDIYERLANIYIESEKYDEADELFQRMTKVKSITPSPAFWLKYATFLMTTLASPTRAREILPRAMQSVDHLHHRELIAKFAALEFRSPNGDAERGRTILEGLLSEWPKRWNLWDRYIALEKARNEKDKVRALFERVADMKMKSRRAKYVFKMWLEFEESCGNTKGTERVKAKAVEFVKGLRGCVD